MQNSMAVQNNAIDEAQIRIRLCLEKIDETLDLSDLGLKQVPDEIKDLKYLKTLDLSENALTELPNFIGGFHRLEYLDLSYNRLSALPEAIGNLSAIETLNIRCNELKTIPESIWKLIMLNNLDIRQSSFRFAGNAKQPHTSEPLQYQGQFSANTSSKNS